jgi:hypothetical protein
MFRPNPIAEDFVPYTKRIVLRNNADLFVDGVRSGGLGEARVALQQAPFTGGPCDKPGTKCGDLCGPPASDPALDPVCTGLGGYCVTRRQLWQYGCR